MIDAVICYIGQVIVEAVEFFSACCTLGLNLMAKGYQIIEPDLLGSISGRNKHFDLVVAIYRWLIPLLYDELAKELTHVEIDIIPVVCHGGSGYPTIGLRYKEDNLRDLGPIIQSTIERLLNERPVIDLIKVIGSNDFSFIEESRKIKDDAKNPG